MSVWQSSETAPRDGARFWALLYEGRQVLMRWWTADEIAAVVGGEPHEYDGAFLEVYNFREEWVPAYWRPFDGDLPTDYPKPRTVSP